MEAGNGIHVEEQNVGVKDVKTNVVNDETLHEVESSKVEVPEYFEDVHGTKMPTLVESTSNNNKVSTNEGNSKNNKRGKTHAEVSLLGHKPKAHITQSLSFPAKPRTHESMRTSMDGHSVKGRAALSNANANVVNPANRKTSTGVTAKESGPNVRVSRVNT